MACSRRAVEVVVVVDRNMLAAAASAAQYQEGVRSYYATDWERFWFLAERVVERSNYGKHGMKPDKYTVMKFVNALQSNPHKGHVWVAQHNGALTGFLLGLTSQWFWANERFGPLYATEAAFYSTDPRLGRSSINGAGRSATASAGPGRTCRRARWRSC